MIDVVYPYYEPQSGWAGNELRFSLRSIEKHLKEDFRVWIVGDLPAWASDEVNHIPAKRSSLPDKTFISNSADIAKKITVACQKFDRFLLIADDQCLLDDITLGSFNTPYYFQHLDVKPSKMTKWQKGLWRTIDKLKSLGLTTYNAECHVPFLIDSKRFLSLLDVFNLLGGEHLWKTAYLNYHYSGLGAKMVPKRTTAFSHQATKSHFKENCLSSWFLCYNNAGLTQELKAFLMTNFNKPSKFEKFSSVQNKIFGVGMPKTGTNSLIQALRNLGYSAKHYPHKPLNLGSTMAAADMPVANNFESIDLAYKNSKFILTIRDDKSWMESASHHFKSSNKSQLAFRHRVKMFGNKMPNDTQLLEGKHNHERKVLDYFKDRPEDLLVLDIFNNEGYSELAQFLNLAAYPKEDFPHLNKRKEHPV